MILNNSRIETYERCPRKYFYLYVLGIQTKRRALHLVGGIAMHAALYEWNRTRNLAFARAALVASHSKEMGSPHNYTAEELLEAANSLDEARALLELYVGHYKDSPEQWLGGEVTFQQPLGSHTIVGRVDAIILNSVIRIRDHKTSATTSPTTWLAQFHTSDQVTTYWWGIEQATDFEVREFEIDLIRRGLKTRDPAKVFLREIVRRSPEDIEDWKVQRLSIIADIERDTAHTRFSKPGGFAKHRTSCHNYGRCPFIDLCALPDMPPDELVQLAVSSDYERRPADYVENIIREEIK